MKRSAIFSGIFAAMFCGTAFAAVTGETVEYKHGDAVLEGYLAYDDATEDKRPGVIVVHEWKGPGPYSQRRAQELAALGYVTFAVDMYGKGIRPKDHVEAGQQAGIYKSDRNLMRERVKAGLEVLKTHPLVDDTKIGAIGYCFGGTTVLELARSGADVDGVVSFHGALSTPSPADAKNIKGRVLVEHGAKDPHVKPEEVAAFEAEMKAAGVDYRVDQHPDAMHSFTVPEANDPGNGIQYDAGADQRSWESMKAFFAEIFA